MTTATATRKTAKRQENRVATLRDIGMAHVLGLTTGKDTVFYRLEALSAGRGRAFRLCKADRGNGPGEVYDVLLDGQFSSCECKGFMRWNHCKHVEALVALTACGKLSDTAAANKPEPAAYPVEFDNH